MPIDIDVVEEEITHLVACQSDMIAVIRDLRETRKEVVRLTGLLRDVEWSVPVVVRCWNRQYVEDPHAQGKDCELMTCPRCGQFQPLDNEYTKMLRKELVGHAKTCDFAALCQGKAEEE